MVMATIDANVILLCPIKNRTDQELTVAHRTLLDNEYSNAMKELIKPECMPELVPSHCHRRNIAEAAIKN